jgi:hypothetical protein
MLQKEAKWLFGYGGLALGFTEKRFRPIIRKTGFTKFSVRLVSQKIVFGLWVKKLQNLFVKHKRQRCGRCPWWQSRTHEKVNSEKVLKTAASQPCTPRHWQGRMSTR